MNVKESFTPTPLTLILFPEEEGNADVKTEREDILQHFHAIQFLTFFYRRDSR
jgi:hypothetical protein